MLNLFKFIYFEYIYMLIKSLVKNIILPLALVFLFACEKGVDTNLNEVREKAWNHLDQSAKSSITIKTEEAVVRKVNYKGNEVFSVTFSTANDVVLGPIIVYLNIENREVIEVGPRP